MRSLAIVTIAFVWMVLGALPTAAQAAGAFPCGRVTAYTAPTSSTPGSITLGTSRFDLAPGSAPDREVAVGSDICMDGERNAAGAYTRLIVSPMGQGVCGVVAAYSAPSASSAGSITLSSAKDTFILPVSAGVALTREQVSGGQCFTVGVNAQGNAEVVRYSGPWEGAPTPSPTARELPGTTVAATDAVASGDLARQQTGTTPAALPAESSGPSLPAASATLAAAAVVLVAGILGRTGRTADRIAKAVGVVALALRLVKQRSHPCAARSGMARQVVLRHVSDADLSWLNTSGPTRVEQQTSGVLNRYATG